MRRRSLRTAIFSGLAGVALVLGLGDQAAAQDRTPSGLEEVLSIGRPDGDKLLMWVGLSVDDDDSLFVTDALDFAIKVFDSQGNLVCRTGKAGEGPGQFRAVRDLALSRSLVYVTDQYLPRISVFDKTLKFLYSIPLSRPVHSLRALPDGTIVAAFPPTKKGEYGTVWLGDAQGRTLAEIPHGTDPDLAEIERSSVALSGPDIILACNFRDQVMRLDRKGRTLWARNINRFPDAKMKAVLGHKVPSQFVYKDVAVDPEGRIYVLGGSLSLHPSQDVYVLSPEGRLLATLVLPEASHSLVVDGKGFLYSRAGEGTTIKKFKVLLPGSGSASEKAPQKREP